MSSAKTSAKLLDNGRKRRTLLQIRELAAILSATDSKRSLNSAVYATAAKNLERLANRTAPLPHGPAVRQTAAAHETARVIYPLSSVLSLDS
jgi:hypothetical protein